MEVKKNKALLYEESILRIFTCLENLVEFYFDMYGKFARQILK
jgi:hypothetical protein